MRPRLRRFLLGLGAGAVAVALSFAIRYLFGGVFLPEVAVNALVSQTPGTVESVLVINLQSLAKYSAFAGAITINIVLYGLLAYALTGVGKRSLADRLPLYALGAYVVSLGLTLLFLSLTQVLSTPQTIPSVAVALLPPQLVFGFALSAGDRSVQTQRGVICEPVEPIGEPRRKFDRKRRLFIKAGLTTGVAAVLLYFGVNLLFAKPNTVQPNNPGSQDAQSLLRSQEVTPTDRFYRVDVNIFTPAVKVSDWTLRIFGLVDNPATLTYSQLSAMNSVEQYNTLECVSNKIGGDLISTAKWKGVRLKDVLHNAAVRSGATYVIFKSADGYDVGIPLDRALIDGTLLAYEMNDAPLSQDHGFPIRVIVPGYYGMMNAKWVTSIEVAKETYQGYWQQRGWANEAGYQTGSLIIAPGQSEIDARFGISGFSLIPPGMTPIVGVAFAGDRGIEKVEVSTDGGKTWMPASIKDPLSGYTWVLWTAEWNPPAVGKYKIAARATDKTGAVQTAVIADPFPSGATGYHIVDVGVTSG